MLAEPRVQATTVLGLGETSHGTLEFRTLPFAVAFALAEFHHEVTLALEIDPAAGLWLNEYGRGCGNLGAGNPADIERMAGSYVELVHRARAHDEGGRGCIRIVGVDAMVRQHAVLSLQGAGRGCLGDGWTPELDALTRQLDQLTPEFGHGLTRAPTILAKISAATTTTSSSHECATFNYLLSALHDTIEIPAPDPRNRRVPEVVHTTDRDAIMARNVAFWAHRGQVVFLAHAAHVAAVEIPDTRGGGFSTPAGVHLRREFGAAYVNVGMHFGEGELAAIRCPGAHRHTVRNVPAPRHPSFERDLLRDLGDSTLLPAARACEGRNCKVSRQYVYCMPLGFNDARISYTAVDLERAFDWFVFFPRARADDPTPHHGRERRRW